MNDLLIYNNRHFVMQVFWCNRRFRNTFNSFFEKLFCNEGALTPLSQSRRVSSVSRTEFKLNVIARVYMQLFFHSLDLKQKSNFDKILVVVTDYRFEKFKKKFMEGTNVA